MRKNETNQETETQHNSYVEAPTAEHGPPFSAIQRAMAEVENQLELDPTIEVDLGEQRDYDPDEPVSKHGIQYTKKQNQVDRMGTDKIGGLILKFAIPSIISMLVNGLYNIIDAMFLGQKLGEVGLATATVAMPIMIMSMAVAILVGAGGNALAALKLGEGKKEAAEKVMGNAFTLTILLAIICTVATNLFMDPVLDISGATSSIHSSAHTFITIISFGFILQFFAMSFNNFMRTAGVPILALLSMTFGVVVCIALNYLFVMVLEFGIAGSAWATVIGQSASALVVFLYFTVYRKAPLKIHRRYLKPSPRLIANILVLGSAAFFLQVAAVVLNAILNKQLVYYGGLPGSPITADEALAAIGVVQRVAMFAFFPILGVSMAIQPLIGFNYGAKLFVRVKQTIKISFIWMLVIGVFFWVLVHLFPQQIVAIFGVHANLYDFTIKAVQVMMFFMPLVGLQVLVSGYFQSTGQPVKSMFVSLTRQLLYLIPLFFILPAIIGFIASDVTQLESLYYAYPVADCLSIITAGSMILYEWRKLGTDPTRSIRKSRPLCR